MNWIANTDTIIFDAKFDEELDINTISSYTKLIFSDYELNEKLFESYANNDVYHFKFNENKFNQDISNLHPILTHLIFGWNFNQNVSELPLNITHLTFGCEFNKDVSKLPLNITNLTFGVKFNQDVSKLPLNITHLTFGEKFNQDVSILPPNITHLIFGFHFNQDISKLPPNLTHLTLGYNFNKKCDVPLNIKYLKLICNNLHIINSLPNSIVELELGLFCDMRMDNFPSSLKKLTFNEYCTFNEDLNCLPNFIEELQLNSSYKKRILNIPSNIKKLKCCKYYPHKDDFMIANTEITHYHHDKEEVYMINY